MADDKTQDQVFASTEGDAWYARNRIALHEAEKLRDDLALQIVAKLSPRRVLEVGGANGFRLAELQSRSGAEVHCLEPSAEAIAEGRSLYPSVTFHQGLCAALPFEERSFDLVIAYFVFHWIDRTNLLRSIAELDRVCADGGHIVIGDFSPDVPTRRHYHHLPDDRVFTFKQDYAAALIATNLYSLVERVTFNHDDPRKPADSSNRAVVSLLAKSLQGYYTDG